MIPVSPAVESDTWPPDHGGPQKLLSPFPSTVWCVGSRFPPCLPETAVSNLLGRLVRWTKVTSLQSRLVGNCCVHRPRSSGAVDEGSLPAFYGRVKLLSPSSSTVGFVSYQSVCLSVYLSVCLSVCCLACLFPCLLVGCLVGFWSVCFFLCSFDGSFS